jgi:hypothetical protein
MLLKLQELFFPECQLAKKRGGKNAGNLHYVIENTWRKNDRFQALHYIIEK